jgi:hypothetical protein
MKLAIILNKRKLSGLLTKLVTGCYAYHVAWVCEETNTMYDMHLLRRKRPWPHYTGHNEVLLYDSPEVTVHFLEEKLRSDESVYGVWDYILFGLRPLYHLFGKSTRNAGGTICSEMVNSDLWECGVETPWHPNDEPPSPCDILKWKAATDD